MGDEWVNSTALDLQGAGPVASFLAVRAGFWAISSSGTRLKAACELGWKLPVTSVGPYHGQFGQDLLPLQWQQKGPFSGHAHHAGVKTIMAKPNP